MFNLHYRKNDISKKHDFNQGNILKMTLYNYSFSILSDVSTHKTKMLNVDRILPLF